MEKTRTAAGSGGPSGVPGGGEALTAVGSDGEKEIGRAHV